jgi:hypothetical protein
MNIDRNNHSYYYLIAYVMGGGLFGTVDTALTTPLTCPDDVRTVQDRLRVHFGRPDLLVLSFSRFADPADTTNPARSQPADPSRTPTRGVRP